MQPLGEMLTQIDTVRAEIVALRRMKGFVRRTREVEVAWLLDDGWWRGLWPLWFALPWLLQGRPHHIYVTSYWINRHGDRPRLMMTIWVRHELRYPR